MDRDLDMRAAEVRGLTRAEVRGLAERGVDVLALELDGEDMRGCVATLEKVLETVGYDDTDLDRMTPGEICGTARSVIERTFDWVRAEEKN